MVCYICNNPASAKCPECQRYICAKHTSNQHEWSEFGEGFICSNCYELERAREKKASEEKEKTKWCDFCRGLSDKHWRESSDEYVMHKCGVCGKKFCQKHGQVISSFNNSGDRDYWYRCINHLKKSGVVGCYEAGFFDSLSLGKPDETG